MNTQVLPARRPVRIANSSGFYGDRLSAAREMVDGGPIDVLTGDYLAELTPLLLHKARERGGPGYARTFPAQMNQVLARCQEKGVKVVSNAGGLEPARLAEDLRALVAHLGLRLKVAHIEGDDLLPKLPELRARGVKLDNMDTGEQFCDAAAPVSAHAYLGGWGIAAALAAGADVVVCGRVTDASLVVGPAAWWHGWAGDDWDALAGAVAAGHVIECGPQCTGGNYSFLDELPDTRVPGFPIAEVAHDGSAVITKHPGTGGVVSVGTVTAQLLYDIEGPAHTNPDVTAHFDTLRVTQQAQDRVEIRGAKGMTGPHKAKVGVTFRGGYRNSVTLGVTGLDIEAKAGLAEAQIFDALGGRSRFAAVDVRLQRSDKPAEQARSNEEATAYLHITVKDPDPDKVGSSFTGVVASLALAGYSGFHPTTPPTREIEYGVYWPTLVQDRFVDHVAVLPDGERVPIRPCRRPMGMPLHLDTGTPQAPEPFFSDGMRRLAPLGLVCGARSGGRGGNANVGIWTRTDRAYAWLREALDAGTFQKLVPDATDLDVERFELPNLRALNFVVRGMLGEGAAAATRADPRAKGLGEFLRSRLVMIPVEFLNG